MEHDYPLFAGRRILKKESLWMLRDYTYAGWQLYYADYTDGILGGCGIRAEEGALAIEKGILKFRGFIYLLQEEEIVPYQPENAWRSLKAEFSEEECNPDSKTYHVRFFLDETLQCSENQLEMCRFYLREGAALRYSYKSFSDMATEYDTVNLIYAAVAGVGETTLHPALLLKFAEELWEKEGKDIVDINFCFLIWNAQGMVERRVIAAYLSEKSGKETIEQMRQHSKKSLYEKLVRIVDNRVGPEKNRTAEKKIIVE
ncbi:hypothetical protein [Candidatus Acetatifactor stercoripullorum]|uniref:hypothetical protein n=1 Tax=Candidatus Acetatifactor stercoripullorum TaxID=2838414 RepID=UPI00298E7015|nr:hypothetical protein [Candidatus Acetatifactor stercoripullorum]